MGFTGGEVTRLPALPTHPPQGAYGAGWGETRVPAGEGVTHSRSHTTRKLPGAWCFGGAWAAIGAILLPPRCPTRTPVMGVGLQQVLCQVGHAYQVQGPHPLTSCSSAPCFTDGKGEAQPSSTHGIQTRIAQLLPRASKGRGLGPRTTRWAARQEGGQRSRQGHREQPGPRHRALGPSAPPAAPAVHTQLPLCRSRVGRPAGRSAACQEIYTGSQQPRGWGVAAGAGPGWSVVNGPPVSR